jgi:hypothetical protein
MNSSATVFETGAEPMMGVDAVGSMFEDWAGWRLGSTGSAARASTAEAVSPGAPAGAPAGASAAAAAAVGSTELADGLVRPDGVAGAAVTAGWVTGELGNTFAASAVEAWAETAAGADEVAWRGPPAGRASILGSVAGSTCGAAAARTSETIAGDAA